MRGMLKLEDPSHGIKIGQGTVLIREDDVVSVRGILTGGDLGGIWRELEIEKRNRKRITVADTEYNRKQLGIE